MSIFVKLLIFLIKLYQRLISPMFNRCCCFYPTCSNYMIIALQKHGLLKGFFLGCKRLLRCHPGSECAIDEVP